MPEKPELLAGAAEGPSAESPERGEDGQGKGPAWGNTEQPRAERRQEQGRGARSARSGMESGACARHLGLRWK